MQCVGCGRVQEGVLFERKVFHGMFGSVLWFSYGVGEGDAAMWFSNASFLVAQSIIVSVLRRHGRAPGRILAAVALAAAAVVAVLLPLPTAAFGWVATVVSATSLVPLVVHVARAENMHAISLATWVATIVSASSWMAYGWVVDDPVISVVNYFTIPMMIYILASATRWRLAHGVPVLGRATPVDATV